MSAFIGAGKVKIAPYNAAVPFGSREFRDVGNTSAFTFNFTETRQELRDYRDPAGGIDASTARIETVTAVLDLRHFTAKNLALALWGDDSALAATPIVDEAHVAHLGGFVPTDRLINTTVAPVVRVGATTVDTDDYIVSEHGIEIVAAPVTVGLVEDAAIEIDYTPQAGNSVQALLNAAPNVSVFFAGINTVTGKPASTRLFKCKVGVAADVGQIGDDFGTLQLTLTVEKDTTIVGAGLSQFLQMQEAS